VPLKILTSPTFKVNQNFLFGILAGIQYTPSDKPTYPANLKGRPSGYAPVRRLTAFSIAGDAAGAGTDREAVSGERCGRSLADGARLEACARRSGRRRGRCGPIVTARCVALGRSGAPHRTGGYRRASLPQNPLQFSLHQNLSNLILKREVRGGQRRSETVGINDVFRHGRPVFVTITSGPGGSATYVDGVFASRFLQFRLADDFTGQLEIGTSPVVSDAWQGVLRGLAVYYRELTAVQVRRHYETWMKYTRPEISGNERPVGLYLFNEHTGTIVHNAIHAGIDLDIPR
jgi:hypothetical protein